MGLDVQLISIGIVVGATLHIVPHVTCNIPRIVQADYAVFMKTIGHLKLFNGRQPSYADLVKTTAGLTGLTMTALLIVVIFFATEWSRTKMTKLPSPFNRLTGFNTFWYSHHILALIYGLLIVHGWFLILSNKWPRKTVSFSLLN